MKIFAHPGFYRGEFKRKRGLKYWHPLDYNPQRKPEPQG